MKQLFLTSSVNAVADDIAGRVNLSDGNRLVFIDTAAEPEKGGDIQWLLDDRQALVDAGFEVEDYTITGKGVGQLKNDLENFDYIYLSGGDTLHLLKESKKSGFFELIKKYVEDGKTYIGTSAGSIITGEKCPDYLLEEKDTKEIEGKTGYGLVNFTVVPHWGSKWFKDLYLGGRLEIAYRVDQVPLILLTDSQYLHVVDGKCEIVDVTN